MKQILTFMLLAFVLSACDYEEVERETGYKGKARVNPWLAAERFTAKYDFETRSLASWSAPELEDATWFIPASILSNESFNRQVEEWIGEGGHLVLLVEHANAEINDWGYPVNEPPLDQALLGMLQRNGFEITDGKSAAATEIEFGGESFQVDAGSTRRVTSSRGGSGILGSAEVGNGRLTVLMDSRIFRNRWIGEKEHADLLLALLNWTEYEGAVGFMRGSGLSFWGLLTEHLWPVLLGLAVLTGLWLWKNFSRFGPVESASLATPLRGYEHHLEALGDFQWRLDHAAGLLAPLRAKIVEQGQRLSVRSGRRDDDFFQFLAERSDLPRERVFRALAEPAPADSAVLTRTAADLQRLLQVLH
jgi:hypothetical protein